MQKVHMVQLWCRIPIVLVSHMVEDCWCWWYQESLTNDYELMVPFHIDEKLYTYYVGCMDDYLSCDVGIKYPLVWRKLAKRMVLL